MRSYLRRMSCLVVFVAGCAGTSQGEEVRDARMERAEDRSEVEQEAADRRGEAHADAVDERYDAREQRVESGDRPGEDGSQELVEISRTRAEYQQQARARLETMAGRLRAAQEKLEVLGARAPHNLKTELNVAAKQYEAVKEDVAQLDRTPPDAWEQTTEQLETREEGFDARMSELEDSIEEE